MTAGGLHVSVAVVGAGPVGATAANLLGCYHRRPNSRASTVVIEDADNELRSWFTARRQNVVVLRPDRYVAALTIPQDLGQALTALRAHLSPAVTA